MDNRNRRDRSSQYISNSRANYFAPAIDRSRQTSSIFNDQLSNAPNRYDEDGVLSPKNKRRTISLHLNFTLLQQLQKMRQYIRLPQTLPRRILLALIVLVLVAFEFILIFEPHIQKNAYAMSRGENLLPPISKSMEKYLTKDAQQAAFIFNPNYSPTVENKDQSGGPKITAKAYVDPLKGLSVTDPVNNVDFKMTPKFALGMGEQKDNRVVYPLKDGTGWLVYTMQGVQVKEDILLRFAKGDRMNLKYEVSIGNALQMRLQPDGSINVYGTELPLYGNNISTGTDKDRELLLKAQEKADKNKLMFSIPAPIVYEQNRDKSVTESKYIIDGNTITLEVKGLRKANYPLTIDPTIYVTSASEFMRGNNESSIDFDTTNNLIQKGKLTGARIPSWSTTLSLPAARWGSAYVAAGGYAYVVGGNSGSANVNSVYWAKFDPTGATIVDPVPGSTSSSSSGSTPVTCSGSWCTNSAYNLPATRTGLSSVVYNGYIYAIGGMDSGCATTNNVCSTVYYSKIGANGEPIGWNTTTALGTGRRLAGAMVYNNRIYVAGGQTSASLNGSTSVESVDIRPDGSLGTWTTTGMTVLPATRWGSTILQNNGYMYLIGGASTTTAANTVHYVKINTDGTLDSWVASSAFTNARMAFGGNFATIYGNYLYITSGCATMTTSACSTFTSTTNDFQLASLNADGSITNFTSYATPLTSAASTAMTGYGLMAWRGTLYGVGGCTALTGITTCSGTTQTQSKYGVINSDGDVSTVQALTALPPHSTTGGATAPFGGRIAMGVAVNNGYIYIIGGCDSDPSGSTTCTSMTPNTSYAAINSDGTFSAPSACVADGGTQATTPGGSYWCVNNETLNGTTGYGAFGVTVYNNTIYTVGGRTGGASSDTNNVCRTGLTATGALSANFTCAASTGTNIIAAGATIFTFARAQPNSGTNGYLYAIGGCTSTGSGIGCNTYLSQVIRCTIPNAGNATPSSCIGTSTNLPLFTGTGIFGGTVYGNYIYLAGGANSLTVGSGSTSPTGATCAADPGVPCGGQLDIVQYAMINSSGAITRTDGTTITGGWHIASSRMTEERRRTTAFSINGYLYVVAGHNGTAPEHTLNDIQRGKIDVNTGDVTGFSALATTITSRWDLRATQANGYIYLMGGCTTGSPPASCTVMNGTAEFVQVYNNWSGSPASYTSSTNRPATDRYSAGATILNGYLYLAGGCTSTAQDCNASTTGTTSTSVEFAPLNADGSIGTWTAATNNLSAARSSGRLESVGGTLYYIGGQPNGGAAQTTVYYSTPNAGTGQPAVWNTTTALPGARSQASSAVYNNRIYITGGYSGTNATGTNTVYYTNDLSAGGTIASWTTDAGTSFQLNRSAHTTMAYGDNLYVMGGFDSTNYLLDVQYAPIASDGSIGAWNFAASLPQQLRHGDGFSINGFMYIFGGRSAATTCTNNTYVAAINADGSLGGWGQTNVKYNFARFGIASAYDGGRAYVLGGMCNATLSGNDRAVYGTLQLQPQLANYSIMIDTDTNVFPSKYLMNGIDGGIAAGWFLRYVSSASATNSWGASTNAGEITLGTPGTYTPLDGSSVNLNTTTGARYYMMFLTIDVQKAFGFPEDITRGPNIYDITLLTSTDPAKRLIHGKTFVGGIQQPLDTPF